MDEQQIRNLVSYNLKRLRNIQNSSQLSLSLSAGLTHNFINDIENCKKGISGKTLAKLCAALHVEPYQLFMPEDKIDNTVQAYVHDFNDQLQKLVMELTERYNPNEQVPQP